MRFGVLLCFLGCQCGEQTDEEILQERIDTTSVHLYVAAKIALTKADDDPRVSTARRRLGAVIGRLDAAVQPNGTADDGAGEEASLTASATDIVALAGALLEMRELGAEVVRTGSEDELDPLLPELLEMYGVEGMSREINLSTDHAVFFAGLWILKVHPRVPTPVPPEILLYEASRIDPEELVFPGMNVLIYGLRSYTYATNELCDLAKRDADGLDAAAETSIARLFVDLGADELSGEQSVQGIAGLQALSHGATAYCYFGRDEGDAAREELEHFVRSAERAGASPEDLALVRAYLAYEEDDLEEARAQLALSKEADWMTPARREEVDEVIAHLDREDTDFIDGYFDKVFFARFVAELVLREAEEAGLFASIQETPAYRVVRRFLQSSSRAIAGGTEGVQEATESVQEATEGAIEQVGDLLDGLRGGD